MAALYVGAQSGILTMWLRDQGYDICENFLIRSVPGRIRSGRQRMPEKPELQSAIIRRMMHPALWGQFFHFAEKEKPILRVPKLIDLRDSRNLGSPQPALLQKLSSRGITGRFALLHGALYNLCSGKRVTKSQDGAAGRSVAQNKGAGLLKVNRLHPAITPDASQNIKTSAVS